MFHMFHVCMEEISFAAWLFHYNSTAKDWLGECVYWRERQLYHATQSWSDDL